MCFILFIEGINVFNCLTVWLTGILLFSRVFTEWVTMMHSDKKNNNKKSIKEA